MTLTKASVETLIDLVENKLSCMEVWDRDDRREANKLQSCLEELQGIDKKPSGDSDDLSDSASLRRRRGRRPKSSQFAYPV